MAITYTYTYPGLDVSTADDSMLVLHWTCTALDDVTGNASYAYSTIVHSSSGDATTRYYDDLTFAALDSWMTVYGNKTAIEASLLTQLEALNNPTQEFRPPAPTP